MKSYLKLKQYKWIIMLMAQFGFKIWWQALFLGDCCSHRFATAANVHHISLEISDAVRPHNNNVCNCTLFWGSVAVKNAINLRSFLYIPVPAKYPSFFFSFILI